MNCNLKLAMAGVGLAGLLVLDPLAAAMKPGEYLNGSWSNVRVQGTDGNRGITFTYLPKPDGSGTLFGAVFGFDNAGEATWLIVQGDFQENQFSASGDIFASEAAPSKIRRCRLRPTISATQPLRSIPAAALM